MLKCLHTLCLKCVQHQTSFNGKVVCPACTKPTAPRTGVELLKFLPDCYVDSEGCVSLSTGSEGAETSRAEEKFCEECMEDTPAVAHCADCNVTLCALHAPSHPHLRASYKHRLQELTSQSGVSPSPEEQPAPSCLVHTNKAVRSFYAQ